MTRNEFLSALRTYLAALPQEERESAMKYYEDYFDDAPSEEEAARQLGSPKDVADGILLNRAAPEPAPKAKHSPWFWVGIIALILFSLPLTLPLAAGAVGVAIGVVCTALGLIVAVIAPFFVMALAFAACFFLMLYLCGCSFAVFLPGAPLCFGLALVFGALAIFCGVFTGYLCKWTGLLFRAIFRGKKKRSVT